MFISYFKKCDSFPLGIAPNTMLAKVCSDKNKPNGQFRIIPDKKEIEQFIRDLPIRKVLPYLMLIQIALI